MGNLTKNIKNLFLHREFTSNIGIEVLKNKACSTGVVGYFYDPLAFVVNFELWTGKLNVVIVIVVSRGLLVLNIPVVVVE